MINTNKELQKMDAILKKLRECRNAFEMSKENHESATTHKNKEEMGFHAQKMEKYFYDFYETMIIETENFE